MPHPHLKKSFLPIIAPDTEVLILGSMPGDRSIAENEYYGHPQNRFWRMLSIVTNSPEPSDYSQKRRLLRENRIGLWDVAQQAQRKGSLDSAIRKAIPNDINGLIAGQTRLRTIAFNGRKAETLYDRHFERVSDIVYLSLPSTSPANAGMAFDPLCERWLAIVGQKERRP